MEKKEALELIKNLSNANGPSGFEDEVAAYVKNTADKFSSVTVDHMNNCYLSLPGNDGNKNLMLDSHLDAVGLVVQAIRPNGTIKFVPLGRWVPANLTAEKMRIRNQDGEWVTGIVATKPPHFMSEAERKAPINIESLSIDVGTTSANETRELLHIDTGCPIVPDTEWQYLDKQDVMIGKAFDNRIGTAVLMTVIHDLAISGEKLGVNLIGAIAAQEEVGCRGAKVTVRKIKPDIAICLEGCPADDTFTPEWLIQTGLKRGPMFRDMDTSFIANPNFQKFAIEQAQNNKIPFTRAVRTGGGIDGSELLYYQGVPTICIGIPVRYEHTNYGIVAYDDFKNTVEVVKKIVLSLNSDNIDSF